MAQLIDTSVFIALERHELDLDVLVRMFPDEPVALAAITASELLVGVHYADNDERRHRREAFVERILNALPVLPFDLPTAHTYARLLVDLRRSGQTVSAASASAGQVSRLEMDPRRSVERIQLGWRPVKGWLRRE